MSLLEFTAPTFPVLNEAFEVYFIPSVQDKDLN
jgi:hypothetical protein